MVLVSGSTGNGQLNGIAPELRVRPPAVGPPGELPEVEIFTAPGLMNEVLPPARFVVPGLITEGLCVVAGPPKQGKSRLMTIIALQVAAGGKALGFVDVEPGPVLYLALEDTKRRQQDRIGRIMKGKPAPANYHGSIRWPRHHQQGRELIERWLDDHPAARMVVIDTWAKYKRPGRPIGNAYEDDYQMAGEVQRLALDRRIALGVVHHTRKGQSEDWVESISGTFGLAAAADCLLLFQRKRGEQDGVLQVTGRDVEESELALAWKAEAGQWVIDGTAEVARASKTERAILEVLRKNGSPMTPTEVALATGENRQTVKSSLFRMSKKDMLAVAKGKYSLMGGCV